MGQLGRNELCRCGSGKKYKRCCLPADEAAEHAALRATREAAEASARAEAQAHADWMAQQAEDFEYANASNAVVDLIHAGRLDEAEPAAHALLERYPDATDGHERLGHVYEARGDMKTAAMHYRKVLAAARKLGIPEDDDNFVGLQERIDRIDPP